METVSSMEGNMLQISRQLSKLNEVLQDQNGAIRELNNRVTKLYDEIDEIRNPNYDQIFSYIDKQVRSCTFLSQIFRSTKLSRR
jgi:hypothetical protein